MLLFENDRRLTIKFYITRKTMWGILKIISRYQRSIFIVQTIYCSSQRLSIPCDIKSLNMKRLCKMKHDIKSRVVIGDKAKCARNYFKGNTFSRIKNKTY